MSNEPTIPGTVQLIDTEGNLHVEHGAGHKEIVLVPQPTDNANDPLRWGKNRKTLTLATAMAWCFFTGAMISGLSPAYVLIEQDTGISVGDLSTGNGIMYLMMGWGTVLTQRLALTFGRRSTLVGSAVLITAMTIWTAFVSTRGEFFANRFLLGTFTSPQETLIEIIVGDLYFTHERGFYLGLYAWALFAGAFFSPIASGYVAEALGWRWIQYILTMVGVGLTLVTFFCFEETMFHRNHTMYLSDTPETADMGSDAGTFEHFDAEKHHDTSEKSALPTTTEAAAAVQYTSTGTKRTYADKLKLWGYRDADQPNPFKAIILPFKMLIMFPVVAFSGVLVGGILSWYNVVGGSLALILSNAPYNFSTNSIGLTYLASVIGVSVGCVLSGWMSDKLVVRMARRNHGIMEPEQRLWICILAMIFHPAGCLLYGVGASFQIHWIGVVIGLGLICVTLPMGSTLAYTYIMDSYSEMAGEGMVSAILIRNMMGFAFGYAVVPMINNLGLRYTFVLIAGLGEAVWGVGLLMIVFGKPLRRASAQRYWNLVAQTGAKAH